MESNLSPVLERSTIAPVVKYLIWVTILSGVYYAIAKLSMTVALPIPPGNVTAVWFPAAIAWFSLFWRGFKFIPGLLIPDLIANVPGLLSAIPDAPIKAIAVALAGSLASTLEAGLGSWLLRRFLSTASPFDSARSVLKFGIIASLCPALSATIGVTAICLGGVSAWTDFTFIWLTWWTGNTISVLVFMPMLLVWQQFPRFRWQPWRWLEAFLLANGLIAIGKIAFWEGYPVQYMMLPCLWWAVFRFGQHGATLSSVFVSGLALWGTINGTSSFVRTSLTDSLILLQTFMGVVAISTLLLSAILRHQQQAEQDLEQANKTLELCVDERTMALTEALDTLQKTQLKLIQGEKMSSLGQLVAGIAHEINNPVNFIHGNLTPIQDYTKDLVELLQLYQSEYPNPAGSILKKMDGLDLEFLVKDLSDVTTSMRSGTERIKNIVLLLRNFSRLDESGLKSVNLHEGIDGTLMLLNSRLVTENRMIEVFKDYGQIPSIECDAGAINQVWLNLISNAFDAVEGIDRSPTIQIRTQVGSGDRVLIKITDNGVGMTEEVRSRMFDPFYTTKAIGTGTGLGLSISYQIIIEQHGGKLWCDSTLGEGTTFIVEMPIRQGV
jgi:two-component system, NtrC family, sensor kinase